MSRLPGLLTNNDLTVASFSIHLSGNPINRRPDNGAAMDAAIIRIPTPQAGQAAGFHFQMFQGSDQFVILHLHASLSEQLLLLAQFGIHLAGNLEGQVLIHP